MKQLEVIKYRIFSVFNLISLFILTTSSAIATENVTREEVISFGESTYYRFCSVCHGENATGDGPFSENIKISPPDLTKLSAENNNIFPWADLYDVINGKNPIRSHGGKEMPIWGEMFDLNRWSSHHIEYADTIVHGRIFQLLMYLDAIQVENNHANE